jgi:type I restriction enzyme S subunit
MSDLPQGWKQSELGALADVAIGGTPSRDIPRYWASNDIDGKPWVAISDLHGRVIDFTSESITEAGIANSNVKLVKRGTVLMSFKLSLGRVA